jgi:phosphate starvation-inducible PhoH-like protein
MKIGIIDSCVLLDFPNVIDDYEQPILTLGVLRELDGLKNNLNQETAFNARRAAIKISRNMDKIQFDTVTRNDAVDLQLISAAKDYDVPIVTNDIYLKVQAQAQNVTAIGYSKSDDYEGIVTVVLETDENLYSAELESILNNEHGNIINNEQIYENEFVLFKNQNDEILDLRQYRKGNYIPVHKHVINSFEEVKGRNKEQDCLLQLLNTPSITIVAAIGNYGSGKSWLLNNYAMQELLKNRIDKIVYIPNNAYTENAMELGFLPGDANDKALPSIGPLIDLIGADYVQGYLDKGQLEIVPLGYIRGRSFKNSIIIANEAQNLTEDHLKLLIGRCGENTRIFFDGDIKQADSQLFRNKNGLRILSQLRKSSQFASIFGMVKLSSNERSLTASAAQYLDEC